MVKQQILTANENYMELNNYLNEKKIKKIFLVCDSSLSFLKIEKYFEILERDKGIQVIKFDDFQPNPAYESVVKGIQLFRKNNFDAIFAVGGGSTIDVAKCIKLFSNMKDSINYLKQTIIPNDIPLLAVPTTAGTGSEATHFAVIYYEGEKQSITDDSCIPSTVLMDTSALKTLPDYQRKSTMLDALCHSIESFWSVNSTEESREYSKQAIKTILNYKDGYLDNEDSANAQMLKAAHIAGKAINITQTTAGHAMCYKLTSLYGIAHGHAAALCDAKLIPFMLKNFDLCIDVRGETFLKKVFFEIAEAMGCSSLEELAEKFNNIVVQLNLGVPEANEKDYKTLIHSVNPIRLNNHPIKLTEESIDLLYHQILA